MKVVEVYREIQDQQMNIVSVPSTFFTLAYLWNQRNSLIEQVQLASFI